MAVAPSYYCSGHLPAQQHEMCWERCWQIFLGMLFCNKDMCLFCEGILYGSSPEAMDIVSLIAIRILQNLHLALGTHCSHQFEPT